MKKIVLIGLLVLIGSCIYAAGAKEDSQYLTITGGYHGGVESSTVNNIKTKTNMSGFALGLESRSMLSDMVGMGVKFGFFWPQSMSLTQNNVTYNVHRSDYKSLFGYEMLLGPAIMPVRGERFGLNITPGLHLGYLLSSTNAASTFSFTIGLGADVSADFYLTKHFYLNGGISFSYDFYSIGSTTVATPIGNVSVSNSGGVSTFMFQPRLGIGFHW